jgi:hypothetical protein
LGSKIELFTRHTHNGNEFIIHDLDEGLALASDYPGRLVPAHAARPVP